MGFGPDEPTGAEACASVDPEVMFPDESLPVTHPAVQYAKSICLGCQVRDLCLEGALARREQWGIWGALTRHERDALRRRLSRRAVRAATLAAVPESPQVWAEQDDLFGVSA
jgi:hypothetical protein